MLKRKGDGQITVILTANMNPIRVGYMKNNTCLVNERSI